MRAKLSGGYSSEFFVIQTAPDAPRKLISNVVLLFPMKDREAWIALRRYLDSVKEVMPELEELYERCGKDWKYIDKSS